MQMSLLQCVQLVLNMQQTQQSLLRAFRLHEWRVLFISVAQSFLMVSRLYQSGTLSATA
jgi:hypothetical protein